MYFHIITYAHVIVQQLQIDASEQMRPSYIFLLVVHAAPPVLFMRRTCLKWQLFPTGLNGAQVLDKDDREITQTANEFSSAV